MITYHSIIHEEITEFVMEGACDVDEIIKIVKSQYPVITKGIMWNFLAGDISNLTPDYMRRVATVVREHAVHEKTALFDSTDFTFGLLRMYEVYAGMEGVTPVMKVFRDRNEAIEWLTG